MVTSESATSRANRSIRAGVAVRDITPIKPVSMSGFAARTGLSTGVHDGLSVRALVVERTAILTVDVVGLHEEFCTRVRRSVRQYVDHVVIHATHTHSGPGSVPGRLGGLVDTRWLAHVEDECKDAIAHAAAESEFVHLSAGYGQNPGVARNRRRTDGPIDAFLPFLRIERSNGEPIAILVSYACHPVVLGPENNLISADYPGVVRDRIEASTGAITLFATSCAGDVNTGHTLGADGADDVSEPRTYSRCNEIGERIASAALEGVPTCGAARISAISSSIILSLDTSLTDGEHGQQTVGTQISALRHCWTARVSVFFWGPAVIVALPGEPFTAASVEIRRRISMLKGVKTVIVLGYSDGCPGYFPAHDEYVFGGYEIEQAHHYYDMPGPFMEGSLEVLVEEALRLARRLALCT